jgi:hypothetical protein
MLLETKVMAKIALLVSATWIVNTFVIGAVLLMILIPSFTVARASRVSLLLAFSGIILALLSDWLFRIGSRPLVTQPLVNVLISLFLLVIPIFFAAIAFAEVLKGRSTTSTALGYNLFGAMVGGILEYFSTICSINSLNLLCIGAYLCAAMACAIGFTCSSREVLAYHICRVELQALDPREGEIMRVRASNSVLEVFYRV